MRIDPLKLCFRILKIILVTITALLLTYSVVFSITGTILIYKGYRLAVAPIKKVQALKDSNPKESLYMSRYRQELLAEGISDSLIQIFMPLDSISPHLKNAVIAAEDDGFYTHPGIDLEAIAQASEFNKLQGQFKHGASTLTQQVAKNFFLNGEKSFERKIKELGFAFLLEHYLGKDRILELYLNYAQWGKNIFGCEAASQYYFKKSASELNRNEAARLAAVLAMPSKLTPFHKTNFMGKRLSVIANNLYMHKQIDEEGFFGLTGSLPPHKDTLQLNNKEKEKLVPIENRISF